jgi:hypothetical protein
MPFEGNNLCASGFSFPSADGVSIGFLKVLTQHTGMYPSQT